MSTPTARAAEREQAAVLALVDASPRDWHRTATLVAEAGSARRLLHHSGWTGLETFDTALADQLAARVPPDALTAKAAELQRLAAEHITVLTVLDEAYPANLRYIYNLPPVLYVRGMLTPADSRAIAVVGTRQASAEGLSLASRIAAELAHQGVTVISGLARGIDTAAHEAALAAEGRTIAVLGSGIESPIYPRENRDLADRICARGALVSQFRPAAPPTKFSFPMRNVVMSGMSSGTVVVEASATSGAKMQARLALEHGKPVFLLESLVTKQAWARDYAERRGARVVRSVDEIVAALTALQAPAQQLSLV